MATTIINGVECRVTTTDRGSIYSKNFRSMKQECNNQGTDDFALNEAKHALFIGAQVYYVGPSLHGKSIDEIASLGKQLQVCDSSIDGQRWVPTVFLPTNQQRATFSF